MPFKKLIWEFCEITYSQNFLPNDQKCQKCFFQLRDLQPSHEQLVKHFDTCFSTQNNIETLKNKVSRKLKNKEWWTTLLNTNKMIKNLFGLITYTSHLNTYNHTNEIGIHWTLDLCAVWGNQVWISP